MSLIYSNAKQIISVFIFLVCVISGPVLTSPAQQSAVKISSANMKKVFILTVTCVSHLIHADLHIVNNYQVVVFIM